MRGIPQPPNRHDIKFLVNSVLIPLRKLSWQRRWGDLRGDLVYAEMRTPNEELLLGGGGSEWLWSGGSADCWAVLYAYG